MEKEVAHTDELREGQMKQVTVDGREILLARVEGKLHAMLASCSHVGAPLADGLLKGGRIRCPWHQACFDVFTGELEEPPAIDSLPALDVREEDGKVLVSIPEVLPDRIIPEVTGYDPEADDRHFVILGGGAAGGMAAETVRQAGFRGQVTLVSKDNVPPYNRTSLSKSYIESNESEAPLLRSRQFYEDYDVSLKLDSRVTELNPDKKSVMLADGTEINYDKILLATGSSPRALKVPGADLENILSLRSVADADKINRLAEKHDRVVVIGASFIGMETAASLTARDLDITVVAPEEYPYEKVFGTEIGKMYKNVHEEHGVNFELNRGVDSFVGQNEVKAVKLSDGRELPADFVLVGIGVQPSTDYLREDLKDEKGAVLVDENLKHRDDIYAAGDIARFKDSVSGESVRIEHWRLALQHGRLAGYNMAGSEESFQSGLFFWTRQYGFSLHYVGHCEDPDEIITWGDVMDRDFISFYVKDGEIKAAAGCGNGKQMGIIVELMEDGRLPDVEAIRNKTIELTEDLL